MNISSFISIDNYERKNKFDKLSIINIIIKKNKVFDLLYHLKMQMLKSLSIIKEKILLISIKIIIKEQ